MGYEGTAFAGFLGTARLVVEAEPSGGPVAPLLVFDDRTVESIDDPIPIEALVEAPASDPLDGQIDAELRAELRTGASLEGAFDGSYRLASPSAFVRDMTGFVDDPQNKDDTAEWLDYLALVAPDFTSGVPSFTAQPGTIAFKAQDTYYKLVSLLRLAGELTGERWDSVLGPDSGFAPGTFRPRILVTVGELSPSCGGAACANLLNVSMAPPGSDFAQEPPGGGPQESIGRFEVSNNTSDSFNSHTVHEFGHNLDMFMAPGLPEEAIVPYCKRGGSHCPESCVLGTEQEAPALQETTAQLMALWGIHALFDGIGAGSCEVLNRVSLGTNKLPHNDVCRPNGDPFDLFTLAGLTAGENDEGHSTGACGPSAGYRLDPLFQAFWEILNRQECSETAPYLCEDFDLPARHLDPGDAQEDLARDAAAEALFYALRVNSFSHEMLVDMMGAYYGCNFGETLFDGAWCDVFEHHDVFACDPLPTCQVCGNQTLDPGEECDDGNGLDTDACTNACLNAACGDGFVWEGVEECDDGNTNDDDGCSSTCTSEGGGGGDDGGGGSCPEGDPGCPGGPCLLDLADEPWFQAFPGIAAYHHDLPAPFIGPFCNEPFYVCREGPPGEFLCHDCKDGEDSGWGCPCGEASDAVTESCVEYTGMQCVSDVGVFADPRDYPVAPKPGACFPDGVVPDGFCIENCAAQERVCGKLREESFPTICIAPECSPPCEIDPLVCDRGSGVCTAPCIIDDNCPEGHFCTNWGECVEGSP